jgi:hypothetical protein
MIDLLYQSCLVPAVEVGKVLSFHDEPYPFYGIEVGRIRRKIEGFEEVPVEALQFVPGGVVEDEDVSLSGGGQGGTTVNR